MEDDPNDLYDPDRWMALGRDLGHFRLGGPEAELFYAAHPELREYVWRWWRMATDVGFRASFIRDIAPATEEDLREMWQAVRWRKVP